jgi:hypothetical protein
MENTEKNILNSEEQQEETVLDYVDKKEEDEKEKKDEKTSEVKEDEDKSEETKEEDKSSEEPEKQEEEQKKDKEDEEEDEKVSKYNLDEVTEYVELKNQYEELRTKYAELEETVSSLTAENNSLLSFKANIEKQEKEDMIKSFYMLSDEDKKDVVENIDKYSLSDIESKLSVICVRNKVSFKQDTAEETTSNPVTYNLNEVSAPEADKNDNAPAWMKAVAKKQNIIQ